MRQDLSKFRSPRSLRDYTYLLAWGLVSSAIMRPSIPIPSIVRVLALRMFGAKVGKNVRLNGNLCISDPHQLVIKDYVWIGRNVSINCLNQVFIGAHCVLSDHVVVETGNHDYRSESFDTYSKKVFVRDGSWLGNSVVVCPGVEIGPDTVVSMGSLVIKSVPSNSILHHDTTITVRYKT